MHRVRTVLYSALAGMLATMALLLVLGQSNAHLLQVAATGQSASAANLQQSSAYTDYLPLALVWHDPVYISPMGVRMPVEISAEAGLEVAGNAGSQWIGTNLYWSAVQPTRETTNWSSFDARTLNAQQAGMDLFVTFAGNPTWAAEYAGGPVYAVSDLVNIAAQMAERYDCDGVNDAPGSPCVHYWSFYGEPDNGAEWRAEEGWGYWGHNGAGYADMLFHVSPAIHAANPKAKVMIGGLAYDGFEEDGGPFVRSFLTDTLVALNNYPGGAAAYIDAVAFDFYPISNRWPTIRDKAVEIRAVMERHNVGSLPEICPEGAYWSSPLHGSSEQIQARRVAQMYVRSLAADVRMLMWYRIFDDAVAGSEEDEYPDRTCGLVRVDGAPKPSYYAYQTFARQLHGARYVGPFAYAGVEGYVYQLPDGTQKTVLWATGAGLDVPFPYSRIQVVSVGGSAMTINDGNETNDLDGRVNGQVTIRVRTDDPQYVFPVH